MLNAGQQLAYNGLLDFMVGNNPYICLTGPGGVGKTFLLANFVTNALDEYEKLCALMSIPCTLQSIYFTATTNKATEILGESLNNSGLTLSIDSISTIHSLLSLKVTNNYSTGKSKLHTTAGTKKIFNALVVIDESSLVDQMLMKVFDTFFDRDTCRIIYVGDHAQLPPINEKLSPIFSDPNIKKIHLTEPVRQNANSHLYHECTRLREAVTNNTPITEIIADNKSIIQVGKEVAFDTLHQVFGSPSLNNRILAYTNNRVKQYNSYLRSYRKLPDIFTAGEIVVNNSAISSQRLVYKMPVEGVYEIEEDLGLSSYSHTSNLTSEEYELSVREYRIRRLNNGEPSIVVKIPQNQTKYNNGLSALKNMQDWGAYYHFKESLPDLRPTDACTIHKSQGSTYDNVFIDLQDISKCREASLLKRLLYVALSRAKNKVYLYGSL